MARETVERYFGDSHTPRGDGFDPTSKHDDDNDLYSDDQALWPLWPLGHDHVRQLCFLACGLLENISKIPALFLPHDVNLFWYQIRNPTLLDDAIATF